MQNVIDFSVILSLAGIYAILVSALDLSSYWSAFNLNVFEYLSLNDILANAIPCFLVMLSSLILMIITGSVGYAQIMEMWSVRHGYGGVPYFVFWVAPAIIFGLLLMVGVLVSRYYNWYRIVGAIIYILIPFVVTVSFVAPVGNIKFVVGFLPNPVYRSSALLIVFAAPFLALVNGKGRALSVKNRRRRVLYVDPSRSALQPSIDNNSVIYLGCLGGFFVLYEVVSDRLIITSTEQLALVPVWEDLTKRIILDGAKAVTSFQDPDGQVRQTNR